MIIKNVKRATKCNGDLRIEIADIDGGVLVPLGRVLAEQIGSHSRRYSSRHFSLLSLSSLPLARCHCL